MSWKLSRTVLKPSRSGDAPAQAAIGAASVAGVALSMSRFIEQRSLPRAVPIRYARYCSRRWSLIPKSTVGCPTCGGLITKPLDKN